MIDLHCHILPGLDDGALDLADSIAMARQAQQDGIEVVCATPHIRSDHDVRIEEIVSRVSLLQRALVEQGVNVLVVPGGELAQTEAERLSDDELCSVSLGGAGGWVLLEPAPGPLSDELHGVIDSLAGRGLGSVLAHPERHAGADFEDRLQQIAAGGCLIQWTAEFIAEIAPEDLLQRLTARDLVHLLGSDAHSSHAGRPVRLAAGFARLTQHCSPQQISWMLEHAPRAILRGEPVAATQAAGA